MHFRFTARDAVPGGGGVGHDDVTLRIDQNGRTVPGALVRQTAVRSRAAAKKAIVWKVNGTRKLAANVQIVLSTNDGKTWRQGPGPQDRQRRPSRRCGSRRARPAMPGS